jgi:hypothetical protein
VRVLSSDDGFNERRDEARAPPEGGSLAAVLVVLTDYLRRIVEVAGPYNHAAVNCDVPGCSSRWAWRSAALRQPVESVPANKQARATSDTRVRRPW